MTEAFDLDAYLAVSEHDVDPRWHYDEDLFRLGDLADPAMDAAVTYLVTRSNDPDTPFTRGILVPADLSSVPSRDGSRVLGIYCVGSYLEPVILLDLAAHREVAAGDDLTRALRDTVEHEIRHAKQESEWDGVGEWVDEDAAEGGV